MNMTFYPVSTSGHDYLPCYYYWTWQFTLLLLVDLTIYPVTTIYPITTNVHDNLPYYN